MHGFSGWSLHWMATFLLCGKTLLTTTTSASAFSSSSLPFRSLVARGGGSLVVVSESLQNSEDEGASQDKDRVPATGWNHNTPKNPEFWQSANGDSAAQASQQPRQDSEGSKPVRTGWLHNTKTKSTQVSAKGESESSTSGKGISMAQDRLKQAMLQQERNHRIVSPPAFHACGSGRQIAVTEHRLSVPLVYGVKNPRIDLAFTIVEEVKDETTQKWFRSLDDLPADKRAQAYIEKTALKNADDMIVYLQGGPGFGSPTPVVGLSFSGESSWGASALGKFKRVVLLDQRGTGKSTPITKQTLEKRFPDMFALDEKYEAGVDLQESYPEEFAKFQSSVREATEFLACHRADNIVQDAEYLREALLYPREPGSAPPGPRPWGGAIGQSYGGFCMMTYLSTIEHPPKVCLMTGGIAPMLTPAYDAYTRLWDRTHERNLMYYSMYPGDVSLIKRIVRALLKNPAKLPSGGRLTARRFLQYGMSLGGSPSSFASMHSLFSSAFIDSVSDDLSRTFVKYFDSAQPFDDNPIYYWLHESIYANGPENSPSNWAAERAYLDKPEEFDYQQTCQEDNSSPVLFFGEMVFPWMSEDYAECSGVGCTVLANALAIKDDWSQLYDKANMRKALDPQRGVSRAAAAVYYGDMYVDFECSMKVAARGGPLEHCKVYITNEYQHSGLRDDGGSIFSKLYGMATGSIRTPS